MGAAEALKVAVNFSRCLARSHIRDWRHCIPVFSTPKLQVSDKAFSHVEIINDLLTACHILCKPEVCIGHSSR
jgi:hypothetical protein